MRISIRGIFFVITVTAIAVAAISTRARPLVSVLSFCVIVSLLYGLLSAIIKSGRERNYWIGFVVFSLGYFFWMGGAGNREFYSVPGVAAEWLSGPDEIYSEYSRYDMVSGATPSQWRMNQAQRGRVRYCANCLVTIYLGLVGGWIAYRMPLEPLPDC